MQKREKITPSRSSAVNAPVMRRKLRPAQRAAPRRRARAAAPAREASAAARRCAPAARSATRCRSRARNVSSRRCVDAGDARQSRLEERRRPSPVARTATRAARRGRRRALRRDAGEVDLVVHDDARHAPRQPRRAAPRRRRPPASSAARVDQTARSRRPARSPPTCARCRCARPRRRCRAGRRCRRSCTGMPPISIGRSTVSRVVPATA